MSAMEIALVLDRFDPAHGGLEHWAFQLASWLDRQGHRVHVVAGECAPEMERHNFVLHAVGLKRSRMAFAADAERCARQLKLDIVHDLGSGWYFDILQPQFGSRLADERQNLVSLPLVERWRRRLSRTPRRRLREIREFEERQYGSPGGRIIAVSQMTRADLEHFNRVAPERLSVIHNGVETERFSPATDSTARESIRAQRGLGNQLVLLLAAHNFRLKGVQTLLKTMARLRNEPVHTLIVGRDETENYQRMAHDLRVEDKVTFCGFVEDIRNYYHAADIYAHPTFYDPCSLAVLEAMACGVPVITSRFNGAAELIEDGVEGIVLHDPASARELTGAIRRLWHPETRSAMRQRAREAALRQSAEKCFERILGAYDAVLRNGQGRDSVSWK
jgi:UDP-glucose:(heptosyl)LPS alpha-1,3-glucosyltransferase